MPKFDYTNMPYEPKQSTDERVPTNAFYNPNPVYKESKDIYTGYHTYSYSGVTYWEHNKEYGEQMNRREAIVILNNYRSIITNSDFKEACEIAISELEKQEDIIIRNIELTELCSKLTNILSENKDTKESKCIQI